MNMQNISRVISSIDKKYKLIAENLGIRYTFLSWILYPDKILSTDFILVEAVQRADVISITVDLLSNLDGILLFPTEHRIIFAACFSVNKIFDENQTVEEFLKENTVPLPIGFIDY